MTVDERRSAAHTRRHHPMPPPASAGCETVVVHVEDTVAEAREPVEEIRRAAGVRPETVRPETVRTKT